jgi:hypothetical protein
MSIVNCPQCGERVMIPVEASTEATVQCPLCHEEYRLEVALDQLPPPLIVVSDTHHASYASVEEDNEEDAAFGAFSGLDVDQDSSDAEAAAAAGPAPAFQFESGSAPPAASASRVRSSRPARRRGNPVRQVVQIVAGGIAGIVMAQLILWWIPLNLSVSNRDLTGFGRKYGQYIPFAVPAAIRTAGQPVAEGGGEDDVGLTPPETFEAAPLQDQASEIPDSEFEGGQSQSSGGQPGIGQPAGSVPSQEAKGRKAEVKPAKSVTGEVNGSGIPGGRNQAPEPAGEQPASEQAGDDFLDEAMEIPSLDLQSPLDQPMLDIEPPSGGLPGDPTTPSTLPKEPTTTQEKPGLRGAPRVGVGDLEPRLTDAVNASVALDAADEMELTEKRRLLAEFYQTFASLGEVLTFIDQTDAALAGPLADVDELVQEVGTQKEKLDLIGAVAPSWMDNSRPNDGVILFGVVQSISQTGLYYQTRLQLASRDQREVAVVGLQDPREHFKQGDKIVVLGTLVEEPSANLAAYTGDADLVVLDGRHYPVAP